jgi:hypothetical protein
MKGVKYDVRRTDNFYLMYGIVFYRRYHWKNNKIIKREIELRPYLSISIHKCSTHTSSNKLATLGGLS